MTSKTFADQPEEVHTTAATVVQGPSFTWQGIAGHWLGSPTVRSMEIETLARREAAVQRWRGLIPERPARL
jgi:hypothetical protein